MVDKSKSKNKKKNATSEENEKLQEATVEEFIPYCSHFDENTILTKNGELLQVIKITGFTFDSVKDKETGAPLTIRDAIRKAINTHIFTPEYAIWIHTIRRKKNLSPTGSYPEGSFSDHLNNCWNEKHDWSHQYVNELYITIIREGALLPLKSIGSFVRSLWPPIEIRHRTNELDKSVEVLTETVSKIVKDLEPYGAQLLTIHRYKGVYYSKTLRFLSKILNLQEEAVPLVPVSISETLPSHKISFGFNSVEIRGDTGRHFGALLSIKEYHEISGASIDVLLQIPQDFMVTETFDFIDNRKALEKLEDNHHRLQVSGDETLSTASGLESLFSHAHGDITDFGEHQITMMVFEDTRELLNQGVEKAITALNKLGVVAIREDIMCEDCFWAQLPANFDFIKRFSTIDEEHIGGYASLYNYPAGKMDRNYWGPAVTVFHTIHNTPYFFNFHCGQNGHTSVIGPFGSGKTLLVNFLTSESIKFHPKIFYLDLFRESEIFIRAINGRYSQLSGDARAVPIRFNPLLIDDNADNRQFVKTLLTLIITAGKKYPFEEEDSDKLSAALEYVFSLPLRDRRLGNILPRFWPFDPASKLKSDEADGVIDDTPASTAERLYEWHGSGEFAHYFDNEKDELDFSKYMANGFDFTDALENEDPLPALVYYITHSITKSLDYRPSFIIINEAWKLLENTPLHDGITNWLDELESKNTVAIFSTQDITHATQSDFTKRLFTSIETEIFFPDPDAKESYMDIFGISKEEYDIVRNMDKNKRQFLLKHSIDSTVAQLSLDGMPYEQAILSAASDNLAVMEGAITDNGADAKVWLPVFHKKVV